MTCPQCGTIMAVSPFVPEQYEEPAYYTMRYTSREEIDREWGPRWRFILKRLTEVAPVDRLLDIGAGNGYFVHVARNEFGIDAHGIEISDTEIQFARETIGVTLEKSEIETYAPDGFSAATMFNVLEHVPDPAGFLLEARRKLVPGGLLAVTTPNPACLRARVRGLRGWGMVCPPHHLNLFSRTGLRRLLERNRLAPLHYSTISTYISWVRRFDTPGGLMRRAISTGLRVAGLGADHFFIAKRSDR